MPAFIDRITNAVDKNPDVFSPEENGFTVEQIAAFQESAAKRKRIDLQALLRLLSSGSGSGENVSGSKNDV